MISVLLIEHDRLAGELYGRALALEGLRTETVADFPVALAALDKTPAQVIVASVGLTQPYAATLLAEARRRSPRVDLIALVERGHSDPALRAMRQGSFDCLLKPVSVPLLTLSVQRCLAHQRLLSERPSLARELALADRSERLLRQSGPAALPERIVETLAEHAGAAQALFVRLGEDGQRQQVSRWGLSRPNAEELLQSWGKPPPPGRNGARPPLVVTIPGRGEVALYDARPADEALAAELGLLARAAGYALDLQARYGEATHGEQALDALTEAYGPPYVRSVIEDQLLRMQSGGLPVTVLMVDLDGFRAVNESHGHVAGSRVLIEAARLLERCVREVDVVGRMGGDEYAVVLMGTTAEKAHGVAERIRRIFASHVFGVREGIDSKLTLSIGLASGPEHASTADDLLAFADRACGSAKERSRDCVVVAE